MKNKKTGGRGWKPNCFLPRTSVRLTQQLAFACPSGCVPSDGQETGFRAECYALLKATFRVSIRRLVFIDVCYRRHLKATPAELVRNTQVLKETYCVSVERDVASLVHRPVLAITMEVNLTSKFDGLARKGCETLW
jgi:hypothetical protein